MSIALASNIQLWPIARLQPYERNARTHSPEQVAQIAASITEFGFTNPVLVDSADGIIAGHGRLMAAKELGLQDVPVIVLDHLSDEQRRAYILADNRLALSAGWDNEMLAAELADLQAEGFDLALTGFTDDELADLLPDDDDPGVGDGDGDGGAEKGSLAGRFLVPPFTVLNAREGWWQDRKRAWLALGLQSEVGRAGGLLGGSALDGSWFEKQGETARAASGTSIFDPVLCEIAYRWFSPEGGTIVDPFAGGSVRGIVAAKLGRQYVGGELRAEQVEANRQQADAIILGSEPMPVWHNADSRLIDKTMHDVQADMLFTCPPYADLEVYSDDPQDISTLAYADFRDAYFEIIAKACSLLMPDSFAVCVVGEVRGKDGNYYDFVGDTVEAFKRAGLQYYNEAILVTAVGSLPIRSGKTFSASRKLGKTHQNVLVFVKGDGKRAATRCGDVEVSMPEGMEAPAD